MGNIGEFKMYRDVVNKAAIVVYTDSDIDTIIEGIVTSNYAIKSLPKRLRKGSHCEGSGQYVLINIPPSVKNAQRNVSSHRGYRRGHSRQCTRFRPEAVYPEILIVLDHNAIRNYNITQALRFVLAFWNAVDMVYSTLNYPKVYLNIAGIIISADDAATLYIAEDTSIKITTYSVYTVIDRLSKYFATELDRFPLRQYDMILAMTTIKFCDEELDDCEILSDFDPVPAACTSEHQLLHNPKIASVRVVDYNWMFGGVPEAIHESAHLFNARPNEYTGSTDLCNYLEDYAMASVDEFRHKGLTWSLCSRALFQNYFSSRKSACLDNKPMWTKPVEEVLPGRWLTLDGQCQNIGFYKSCRNPDVPVCRTSGCKAPRSPECNESVYIPLPGTKCGENKYCKFGTGCVDE